MKRFKAFTLLTILCGALTLTACSDVGSHFDGYDDTQDTIVVMDTDDVDVQPWGNDTDGFDDDIDDVLPIPDAGGEDPDCELGTEHCPCYTDLTCDDGLHCVQGGYGDFCRPIDDSNDDCELGTVGCPCYTDLTCDEGLECTGATGCRPA